MTTGGGGDRAAADDADAGDVGGVGGASMTASRERCVRCAMMRADGDAAIGRVPRALEDETSSRAGRRRPPRPSSSAGGARGVRANARKVG